MQTISQLRAEVYNAINNDSTLTSLIGDRIYWLSRPTVKNVFPLISYSFFDTLGIYTFDSTGVNRSADDIIFQTDIYTDPSDITSMDAIVERIKAVMNTIGYRNINSPIEFLETDINKIIRPMRWERFNV